MHRQTLFQTGELGAAGFRIPSLLALPGARVLAFCEARANSLADWGEISIAMRESDDGGRTFGPARIILKNGHTLGNPAPVYDPATKILWLLINGEDKTVSESDILRGKGARQTLAAASDNLGKSWSPPRDLSRMLMKPGWTWHAFGPGHGVRAQNGRLAVGCNHAVLQENGKSGPYTAHVSYTDDHGKTWRTGLDIAPNTNECALAVSGSGRMYANMRSYAQKSRRAAAYSDNGGESFHSFRLDPALTEPVCQGSAQTAAINGREALLFANPASETARENLTLRASFDFGLTWPRALPLNRGFSAYSDLAIAPNGEILCLFECGENGPYERIDLVRLAPEELSRE